MKNQQKNQVNKIVVQAGIRSGFWIAFGAGAGGLQIVPKSDAPASSVMPMSTAVNIPVESGK